MPSDTKTRLEVFLRMSPEVPQYSKNNQHQLIAGAYPLHYLEDNSNEEKVAPLAASLDWAQISGKLTDYDDNQDTSFNLFNDINVNQYYAQSFNLSAAAVISAVRLKLKKTLSPTGSVTVKIYATTGTVPNLTPTGAALATSDPFDVTTLTTSFSNIDFKFTGGNRITLNASTQYMFVFSFTGGDSSNFVTIGLDSTKSSTPSYSRNVATSVNGSSWTVAGSYYLYFKIFLGGLSASIEGNIVHMIPSQEGTYSAYAITDQSHVYGVTPTAITDLGYPTGSANNHPENRLCIAGTMTVAGVTSMVLFAKIGGQMYKMPIPSGTWATAGASNTNLGRSLAEPFLDFVAIAVADASSDVANHYVKKFDPTSFVTSAGINIGLGWGLQGFRNYNNKYLAIVAGRTQSGAYGYSQNYLFLWDGIASRYNNSVKIPGKYIDMIIDEDGVLNMTVQLSATKAAVFVLSGLKLIKKRDIQIASFFQDSLSSTPQNLANIKGMLGMTLNNVPLLTNDLKFPLLVMGKGESGEFEFIHSYGRQFNVFSDGYDGNVFAAELSSGNKDSTVYFLPSTSGSPTYQQLYYWSQWVPVDNPSALDIVYLNPPQAGTDKIQVKVYGRGEDIIAGTTTVDSIVCQSATQLTDITPTNFLNQERTRLDLQGFVGKKMLIKITTINTTWQPVIKEVNII